MMEKTDKPYLDKPVKVNKDDLTKETLIYDGETLEEIEKKNKEYQEKMLNE